MSQYYLVVPENKVRTIHTKKMTKEMKLDKLDLRNCQICGSAVKSLCSTTVHHASDEAAKVAIRKGLPFHRVQAHRILAAKGKMRELGMIQQKVTPPEKPEFFKPERQPEISDPYDLFEEALGKSCSTSAPDFITGIRRAFHHVLKEHKEITYMELLRAWAKKTKRELPEARRMIGSELQVLRKCEGDC